MLYYPRCFSLKHILRPIVIDCSVMAVRVLGVMLSLLFLLRVGAEKPLSIFTEGNGCYLGSHVSVMVLILDYVRSKWSRVHTFDHRIVG